MYQNNSTGPTSPSVTDAVQTFSWPLGSHDQPLTRQRIFTVNIQIKLNNHKEAKTRTRQIQCAARRMETPGPPNNITENPKQKKTTSRAPADQAIGESPGPNQPKRAAPGRGHHGARRPTHRRASKECSTATNHDWANNQSRRPSHYI